jgi:hypothetical protein
MNTKSLAALFQLCLARRAIEQLQLPTIAMNYAKLDIDEQIEAACQIMGLELDFVWKMFAKLGTDIQTAVHNASNVETCHVDPTFH